jgi:hypothetical protein
MWKGSPYDTISTTKISGYKCHHYSPRIFLIFNFLKNFDTKVSSADQGIEKEKSWEGSHFNLLLGFLKSHFNPRKSTSFFTSIHSFHSKPSTGANDGEHN